VNLIELLDCVMLLLKVFTLMDGQTTNYSEPCSIRSNTDAFCAHGQQGGIVSNEERWFRSTRKTYALFSVGQFVDDTWSDFLMNSCWRGMLPTWIRGPNSLQHVHSLVLILVNLPPALFIRKYPRSPDTWMSSSREETAVFVAIVEFSKLVAHSRFPWRNIFFWGVEFFFQEAVCAVFEVWCRMLRSVRNKQESCRATPTWSTGRRNPRRPPVTASTQRVVIGEWLASLKSKRLFIRKLATASCTNLRDARYADVKWNLHDCIKIS
jgi:hypothetical protein